MEGIGYLLEEAVRITSKMDSLSKQIEVLEGKVKGPKSWYYSDIIRLGEVCYYVIGLWARA